MSALLVERTRHWRTCDTCDGSGEVFVRHPNYGSYNCPYDGDDEPCPNRDCYEGVIEVWTDPLVLVRQSRKHRFHPSYRKARERAMRKEPEFVSYYFAEAGIRFMATARSLGYLEAA